MHRPARQFLLPKPPWLFQIGPQWDCECVSTESHALFPQRPLKVFPRFYRQKPWKRSAAPGWQKSPSRRYRSRVTAMFAVSIAWVLTCSCIRSDIDLCQKKWITTTNLHQLQANLHELKLTLLYKFVKFI